MMNLHSRALSAEVVWLVLSLLFFALVVNSEKGASSPATIDCLYLKGYLILDRTTATNHTTDVVHHRCSLDNHEVYNLPYQVLDKVGDLNALRSGITRLFLTGVEIIDDEMLVADMNQLSAIVAIDSQSRQASQSRFTGTFSTVVVRIQSQDGLDVSWSVTDLEESFFELGTATTFANQYRQCSNGALIFEPGTAGGVLNLSVNLALGGRTMSTGIENAITAAFEAEYGSVSQYDYILFCLPKGMATTWTGYTYGVTWRSYYRDEWCGYYSLPVHEMGHQLGWAHSTEDGDEYGDLSCLMGTSYSSVGSPRMCFNGAKMWQAGWYVNNRVTVNPARDGPWRGKIVGFTDVGAVSPNDSHNVVLVNVADLYLLHNRLRNFNSQSLGHGNQLTVARLLEDGKSDMLEGLHPSLPKLEIEVTLDNAKYLLVIEICERIVGDITSYDASIRLSTQISLCSTPPTQPLPTFIPASSPTLSPTPGPIRSPTPLPTRQPTTGPTRSPTPKPTAPPTPKPTASSPSPLPTRAPTPSPTSGPNIRQTPVPTSAASLPGLCFSGRMQLELANGTAVTVEHARIGDVVKVDDFTYDTIYAFGHRDENIIADYLQMQLDNGKKLEISVDHLVFVEGGTTVPASMIRAGNKIVTGSGDVLSVVSVKKVKQRGAYAPFTFSGTVVVNGVKSSNYVTLQSGAGYFRIVDGVHIGISHHWMAHNFLAPFRWIGSNMILSICVPAMTKACLWLLALPAPILLVLSVPLLLMAFILNILSYLMERQIATLVCSGLIIILVWFPSLRSSLRVLISSHLIFRPSCRRSGEKGPRYSFFSSLVKATTRTSKEHGGGCDTSSENGSSD